jgi:hypothetical protein
MAVRAAVCGSPTVRQCAAVRGSVRQCVFSSAEVCGSAAVAGSVWQGARLGAAVRGGAQQRVAVCGSVLYIYIYIHKVAHKTYSLTGSVGMTY